ncbi:hypothetical protein KSP40_PGU001455 [Platanthera guangdongensis]|uniref:Uncharacterized protein n=1 Tax=Platanthera guangdongensis TaxID=2320717 RepID=A0ABR2LMR5_9ASPA
MGNAESLEVFMWITQKNLLGLHFVYEEHSSDSPIDIDDATELENVDLLGDDDSQYEDGELRESVLNSCGEDEVEEVETEHVDYGSDCREAESFEAESEFCSQSVLAYEACDQCLVSELVMRCLISMHSAKYTWRASSTEQQVYKIWKSYFSRAMTSEMRRIRNAAKSRSAPPPTWMRREIFEGLWDIWEARKFKDLQECNRKNRHSDRDGQGVVKSTSGTISIHHHAHRMASGGPKNGRCYGFGETVLVIASCGISSVLQRWSRFRDSFLSSSAQVGHQCQDHHTPFVMLVLQRGQRHIPPPAAESPSALTSKRLSISLAPVFSTRGRNSKLLTRFRAQSEEASGTNELSPRRPLSPFSRSSSSPTLMESLELRSSMAGSFAGGRGRNNELSIRFWAQSEEASGTNALSPRMPLSPFSRSSSSPTPVESLELRSSMAVSFAVGKLCSSRLIKTEYFLCPCMLLSKLCSVTKRKSSIIPSNLSVHKNVIRTKNSIRKRVQMQPSKQNQPRIYQILLIHSKPKAKPTLVPFDVCKPRLVYPLVSNGSRGFGISSVDFVLRDAFGLFSESNF